jgi:regulator of sigma E protease
LNIVIAILVFSVLIVIHELGHFIAARRCGILVEEFSIGMGPKLFGFRPKGGETLYTLRLLPIGGSCRMLGEDVAPDKAEASQQSAAAAPERSFSSKPVSKRIVVIAAGIVMNLLLAFVAAFVVYSANRFNVPKVDSLIPGYPAEAAGLMPGDRITKVNGKSVGVAEDVSRLINEKPGDAARLTLNRDGETVELTVTPMFDEASGRYLVGFNIGYVLGMFTEAAEGEEDAERASFLDTAKMGFNFCVSSVKNIFGFLGQLITRKMDASQVSGPIGIINLMGDVYNESVATNNPWTVLSNILMLVAGLSVNLAVFNFLPIPALDGGRIVFLIIEAVRGKPVNPEKEGMIHFAGMVLLMILMVFVAYNDILKII